MCMYRLKVQRREKEKDSRYIQESCVFCVLPYSQLVSGLCTYATPVTNSEEPRRSVDSAFLTAPVR